MREKMKKMKFWWNSEFFLWSYEFGDDICWVFDEIYWFLGFLNKKDNGVDNL